MELYQHQKDAIAKLRNGNILWGGVGTGKSMAAAAYYMAQEAPKDVYVITTAKKRDSLDWLGEFAAFGVGEAKDATVAGVLTIDSWNNIGKYIDVRNSFFIFDEQRLVGSGAWTKSFIKIAKHNRWILLSATPGDTWIDYIPVFVANGFYKNRTEFKREHVVYNTYSKFPKVDRYVSVGRLVKYRNQLLVEMPYVRNTNRCSTDIIVDYDVTQFNKVMKKRWHVYENRPLHNVAEMFSVMRKVVNSDSSRLRATQSLMEKHPKLIVFYNFDYELDLLRTLENPTVSQHTTGTDQSISGKQTKSLGGKQTQPKPHSPEKSVKKLSVFPSTTDSGTTFSVAEWNGHNHHPLPTSDRWVYLVQYVAGSEGWNCVETDAMVFYSLTYSYKNWHQAHGRIDRLNTPFIDLFYYTLKSNSAIDQAVAKSLRGKKSFNEANLGVKF